MTGVTVDWQEFYANERRLRTVLPTYPFERKRYWPDSPIAARVTAPAAEIAALVAGNNKEFTPSVTPQPMPTTIESPQTVSEVQPDVPRKERLLAASRSLMEELSGYDLSEVDASSSLLELGLDSLLLTQAAQVFHKKFGVSISFRQLMEELGSLKDIAEYLDSKLAPEAFAAPAGVSGQQAGSRSICCARSQTGFRASHTARGCASWKYCSYRCSRFRSRTNFAAATGTDPASFAVDEPTVVGSGRVPIDYSFRGSIFRAIGSDGNQVGSQISRAF
jgi:acyl transferase domain-containing protein